MHATAPETSGVLQPPPPPLLEEEEERGDETPDDDDEEEEGTECPLAAIFYADFDNDSGRKLVHQYPPGKFTHKQYRMLASRIICDKEYCGRVTVIDAMAIPWTLATFPSSIRNDKYDRGRLSFNISFVFKKGHATGSTGRPPHDTEPFIKVLERFGWWLREMELRFGYLSGPRKEGGSKIHKVRLRECLGRAYKGIKNNSRAWLKITGPDCPSMVTLLQPYLTSTPLKNWRKIQDHDVPVRRCPGMVESVSAATSSPSADPDASWGAEVDMVVQQVIPHINGVKHVKKISRDSQVEIAAVKNALQWVLYTNQILLTDVFRYGNVYVQTAKTAEYTRRPDFRKACWERIAKPTPVVVLAASENASSVGDEDEGRSYGFPQDASPLTGDGDASRAATMGSDWGGAEAEAATIPEAPHPLTLTKLYASFQCDRCVMDVLRIAEGPEGFVEQFDHRRMCSFGVEVGILRRLHCVPLCVRAEGKEAMARREAIRHTNYPRQSLGSRFDLEYVQRLLNGRRTEDALCCFLCCSPQELTDFATSDGSEVYRTHPF